VAFSFTVTARDVFNNVATGYAGTVHITSTDGAAVLPANSTLDERVNTSSAGRHAKDGGIADDYGRQTRLPPASRYVQQHYVTPAAAATLSVTASRRPTPMVCPGSLQRYCARPVWEHRDWLQRHGAISRRAIFSAVFWPSNSS